MTQLTSMSQIVHVVSMLDVPRRFKSVSFQSKDVKGALNSLFLVCKSQAQPDYAWLQANDVMFCSARMVWLFTNPVRWW